VPTITAGYSGFVLGQNASALTTPPTCSTTATITSVVGIYPSTCSGAVDANYTIGYVPGTVSITQATTLTAITSNLPNPSAVNQAVTVGFKVTPQFLNFPTGSVTITSSTGETCAGALSATGLGSCQIILLSPGSKTLTARYPGDPNFIGSTSASVPQAVTGPLAYVAPTSLTFANTVVGTTSPAQIVTLTNLGNATLTINSIGITGTGFVMQNQCGTTLRAGRNCAISVSFRPIVAGAATATLTISTNDPIHSALIVSLSGTGTLGAAVTLNPTSLTFPSTARGTPSALLTVTVTSTGGSNLILSGITIGGNNAGDFAISGNTCLIGGGGMAPGVSCTVSVTFTPTRRGGRSSNLRITDNAPGSPQSVPLSGTGL
jgi:hypothetical protein